MLPLPLSPELLISNSMVFPHAVMYFILEFRLVDDGEMKPIQTICDRYKSSFASEAAAKGK